MVFWEKKFLSAILIEKKILSLKWAEQNILLALCALKNVVFVKKINNNVATNCREKKNLLRCEAKKIFDSEKTNSPPPL